MLRRTIVLRGSGRGFDTHWIGLITPNKTLHYFLIAAITRFRIATAITGPRICRTAIVVIALVMYCTAYSLAATIYGQRISSTSNIVQPYWVCEPYRICIDVKIGIQSALQAYAITGDVSARLRIIVPKVVVVQSHLDVIILPREAQVECEGLPVAVRVLVGYSHAKRVGIPTLDHLIGAVADGARRAELVGVDVVHAGSGGVSGYLHDANGIGNHIPVGLIGQHDAARAVEVGGPQ